MSPQLRTIALGYARRYLARADDADDAASDAMLRLWAVHDSLRDTAHAARLADNNTPESQLEWKENEQWLRQRIEQLPPREMQVMRLRQTEHRTNEQIAAILGISKDSVVTMLSSARRKLFNQIKERNRT